MKTNKLLIHILTLFISFVLIFAENRNGTVESDGSFLTFCKHGVKEGEYTKRSSDHSENGDLCTIKYPIKTEGEEAAKRFCKVALPYRLHEVKHGKKTTCVAESLIICPPNYQQIDGQCFLLVHQHEHYTYDEAVNICKEKNATIARLKKSKTSAYWQYYFSELSMVWVDVSDDIAALSILNEGDKYAVLYSSAILFRKRRHSLVQINGTSNRGLVMCEKPHKKTGAFVIQKMKKYGEIYYESILDGKKGYFRTSNRYWRAYGKTTLNDEVCKNVAKPFAYIDEEGYLPYNLKDVETFFGENLIVARSVMDLIIHQPEVRNTQKCFQKKYETFESFISLRWNTSHPLGLLNHYHDPCDNQWSTAYFKVNETMSAKMVSDAMRAPFLCQTHLALTRYDHCPENDVKFQRTNGETVCHRLFRNKLSWDAAQDYCKEHYGGYLSGFTSKEEYDVLKPITPAKGLWQIWIGGKRIKECEWGGVKRNGVAWDNNSCTKAKASSN